MLKTIQISIILIILFIINVQSIDAAENKIETNAELKSVIVYKMAYKD